MPAPARLRRLRAEWVLTSICLIHPLWGQRPVPGRPGGHTLTVDAVVRLRVQGPGRPRVTGLVQALDSNAVVLRGTAGVELRVNLHQIIEADVQVGTQRLAGRGFQAGAAAGGTIGILAGAAHLRGREPRCRSGLDPCPPYWTVVAEDLGIGLAVGAGLGAVIGRLVGGSVKAPVWEPLEWTQLGGGHHGIGIRVWL